MEKKIMDIFRMCIRLNNMPTTRNMTGFKPTVQCEWDGIKAVLTVNIWYYGYNNNKPDEQYCIGDDSNSNTKYGDINKCTEQITILYKSVFGDQDD